MSKKINKKSYGQLLKDVAFISIVAIGFFLVVGKFGGYLSDLITKSSCNAVDEKYVPGKNPGDGLCVKTVKNTDVKK